MNNPGGPDGIRQADYAIHTGIAAAVTAVTITISVALMATASGRVVHAGLHIIRWHVHLGAMWRTVVAGGCRQGPGTTHGCDHQCEDQENQQQLVGFYRHQSKDSRILVTKSMVMSL